ncbi:hypothetical protein Dtox_1047 [Desulfofarcimen acetoxidans DSM 771]|uniref:Cell division protein FtsL n=1 Tax=Desulfofarcimen acetoxidans (strain ATCC 49208 / DSM 771 / KCTC 5769 / VKM B-1644 / 5575) TaxID=485916 RepID=C8W465_DESAS|nr:cell division protein FtsL [Desulfofarcimen acetoxidans]ACV61933.1 hypothetical protein Dtox_1047 [Desulfofarcimen acetoxidans DSM 771]
MVVTQNLAEKLNPTENDQMETLQQPPTRSKKHFCISRSQCFVFTSLVLAAFLTGAVISFYCAQIFTMGYKMSKMKKEIAEIQNDSQDMQVEITRLSSLDRVEAMATQKLGMVAPGRDIVLVDAPLTKQNQVQSPVQAQVNTDPAIDEENVDPEKSSWVIEAITQLVSYLEQHVKAC